MFGKRSIKMFKRVTFVDPGMGGTGVAFFPEISTKASNQPLVSPEVTSCFNGKRSTSWDLQCWEIVSQVMGFISSTKSENVVIEMPALWTGSATSMASATHKGKNKKNEPADLLKLVLLVGALSHEIYSVYRKTPILVEPMIWKGQLPKPVTDARVTELTGLKIKKDHESDAIGMGLSAQGFFD